VSLLNNNEILDLIECTDSLITLITEYMPSIGTNDTLRSDGCTDMETIFNLKRRLKDQLKEDEDYEMRKAIYERKHLR